MIDNLEGMQYNLLGNAEKDQSQLRGREEILVWA